MLKLVFSNKYIIYFVIFQFNIVNLSVSISIKWCGYHVFINVLCTKKEKEQKTITHPFGPLIDGMKLHIRV